LFRTSLNNIWFHLKIIRIFSV